MAHKGKSAQKLYESLHSVAKDMLTGDNRDFDVGNGKFSLMRRDQNSFDATLYGGDGSSLGSYKGVPLEGLATQLIIDGLLVPKDDETTGEKVDTMKAKMNEIHDDLMECFLDKDLNAGKDPIKSRSNAVEDYDEEDEAEDEDITLDSKEEDDLDQNDDGLADESEKKFDELDEVTQMLIQQLQQKHEADELPQIDDYPAGGYDVKVHGADGFYYVYLITPENEVVHLCTMGKSRKWATMEDVMLKSNWGFKNDMKFFKAGSNQVRADNAVINADHDTRPLWREEAQPVKIVPDIASYSDSTDNGLTSKQKAAIAWQMENLKGRIYSVVNNNDMTYTVKFETASGQKAFIIDRDADMKQIGTSPTVDLDEISDVRSFKSFHLCPTTEHLRKGFGMAKKYNMTVLKAQEDKSKKISMDDFSKLNSFADILEPHKQEVLKSQNQMIKSKRSDVVKW